MINVSWFRIFLSYFGCLVGILLPILLFYVDGNIRYSLSQYVKNPETYWIFKTCLILISFAFLTKVKYVPASILLWLIVLFDITTFPFYHNISAGGFFFFMTGMMYYEKSFNLVKLMIFSLVFLYFNLFWYEVCGIILISLHQIKILERIETIKESEKNIFINDEH